MAPIDSNMAWYNFKTDDYDYIPTPTDFHDYIPQDRAALGLYDTLIAMGKTPIDAVKYVLTVCVGEEPEVA